MSPTLLVGFRTESLRPLIGRMLKDVAAIRGKDEVDTLLVVLVPVAAVTALGHLVAIITSDRLR